MYITNLQISICLESGGPCEISNQTVFNNSLLAFRQCNWAQTLPSGESNQDGVLDVFYLKTRAS
jgi:hypothetical protein